MPLNSSWRNVQLPHPHGAIRPYPCRVSDEFKRSWRGWTRSSEGFEVRLRGRNNLEYRDGDCHLRLFAEPTSARWNDIVVYGATIPDTAELPKTKVIERLGRAFAARGWNLLLDDEQQA